MAPPDLYDQPPRPGLMTPGVEPAQPVDLQLVLWTVAAVLAAVEVCLEFAVG